MDKNYKPMKEYYKNKEPSIVCHNQAGSQNQQILLRIERDIAKLQTDIISIKDDLSIIKGYILIKKKREEKAWF
tara:strand:+ start:317 stop:538 length:222 start_codon:yes stop_codon:yes gene_type:complete